MNVLQQRLDVDDHPAESRSSHRQSERLFDRRCSGARKSPGARCLPYAAPGAITVIRHFGIRLATLFHALWLAGQASCWRVVTIMAPSPREERSRPRQKGSGLDLGGRSGASPSSSRALNAPPVQPLADLRLKCHGSHYFLPSSPSISTCERAKLLVSACQGFSILQTPRTRPPASGGEWVLFSMIERSERDRKDRPSSTAPFDTCLAMYDGSILIPQLRMVCCDAAAGSAALAAVQSLLRFPFFWKCVPYFTTPTLLPWR